MSEVKNSNESNDTTLQSKIETLKKQIPPERIRGLELLQQNGNVRNTIYELLLSLSNQHRIENIDDVCDFMDDIAKKYGLIYQGDSDIGRLYTELSDENRQDSMKKNGTLSAKQCNGAVVAELVNSDDDIFSNPDENPETVVAAAESRIELYKELLHNLENSNYEYQLLLDKLNKIQERYNELAKDGKTSNIKHPTVEDFCF